MPAGAADFAPSTAVGIQFHIQGATVAALRAAWRQADQAGLDSIWIGDHFFPVYGDPSAYWYEPYTLLAAMAVETDRALLGPLVACNGFRNPDLLADMSRNIDHLSGGRFVLGVGAGGMPRDFDEYGLDFGTTRSRLAALEEAVPRIRARFARLSPPPVRPIPILIGGGGETTLRLAARHADIWNWFGPPESWIAKSRTIDQWCEEYGRDPASVERTVAFQDDSALDNWSEFVEAGARQLIVGLPPPFDLERVLALQEAVLKATGTDHAKTRREEAS